MIKKLIFPILLIASCRFVYAQDCKGFIASGDKKMNLGDYQGAISYYDDAIAECNDVEAMEKKEVALKKMNASREVPCQLSVSNKTWTFQNTCGKTDIKVEANKDWSVKTDVNWLTCERDGKTIYIEVQENRTIKQREATITVTGCKTEKVKITQQGAKEYLDYNINDSSTFTENGGTRIITVYTNNQDKLDWINTKKFLHVTSGTNGRQKNIKCDANDSKEGREGTIIIKTSTGMSKNINFYQEGKQPALYFASIGIRILSSAEVVAQLKIKNADYLEISAGMWDILRSNNTSGGVTFAYIWKHALVDDKLNLFWGAGLGFGGCEKKFAFATLGDLGIEWTPCKIQHKYPFGIKLEYRPLIGASNGFYHNATNFNLGFTFNFTSL